MKLADRVAIVTGAASGMGRAVATIFASEGASVAVADINRAGADETVTMIEAAGGRALAVHCDVSVTEQVQQMVRSTVEAFGRIDILYNNAAMGKPEARVSESVVDMPEEHWQAMLDINLSGYYRCAKYALPEMFKVGGGVVLNVSSTAALVAAGHLAAYAATKAGIIALTRSMAADYASKGVRVNAICPGPIDTPRFRGTMDPARGMGEDRVKARSAEMPLGRIGTPEDVAKLALFLASDDASFITGVAIPIDGGSLLRGGLGG